MPHRSISVSVEPWATLSPADRAAVRGLTIAPRQIEYAGTTASSIAACEDGDPSRIVGLALRVDVAIVGFVVMKRGDAAPDWAAPDAAVVSGLRVDAGQQGKGIGTAAMRAIADWVRRNWRKASSVALTVDEENIAAIRAYAHAGWVDHGQRFDGRIGPVRRMSLPLHD